jgi:hypothetical protein
MGAHHFQLKFVPIGARLAWNAEGQREGWPLVSHDIPPAVAVKLRELLPKPNHWGSCEEFNSSHDWGSDLRIFTEGGKIVEVGFRYSPGCDPVALLKSVVDLAKEAGCDLLVVSTREIIPADFESIVAALRAHRAFRFLSDPTGAIKETADEAKR